MDRSRYFRSSNQLNIIVNLLSGNIFPLGDEHTPLSYLSLVWVTLMWLTKVTYFLTSLAGSLHFADLTAEELFKKSGAMGVLCVEMIIATVYLNFRRKDFRKLVNEYNVILIDSGDLRRCVYDTVEPYRKGLKYYMILCFCLSPLWKIAPLVKIIDHDVFTYANFTVPAYYPGEPFGRNMFTVYVMFQVIGGCSMHLAKISVEMYIIHYIAVLSAQYKYVGEQLCKALKEDDDEKDELTIINGLHDCIRHHCAVIKIGRRLAELLAFYVGATYFNCIMKFCFLAFGVITFGSANIEKVTYLVYAFASIVQVFLLCSSIEELLTESTSVAEAAFHENWYTRSISVKKIFCMMSLSNQLGCRLSAYGIVDLGVPTLALILSKSYSICLFLLEAK